MLRHAAGTDGTTKFADYFRVSRREALTLQNHTIRYKDFENLQPWQILGGVLT